MVTLGGMAGTEWNARNGTNWLALPGRNAAAFTCPPKRHLWGGGRGEEDGCGSVGGSGWEVIRGCGGVGNAVGDD